MLSSIDGLAECVVQDYGPCSGIHGLYCSEQVRRVCIESKAFLKSMKHIYTVVQPSGCYSSPLRLVSLGPGSGLAWSSPLESHFGFPSGEGQ